MSIEMGIGKTKRRTEEGSVIIDHDGKTRGRSAPSLEITIGDEEEQLSSEFRRPRRSEMKRG